MKPAARNFGRGAASWAGLAALALALPGLAIDPRMFFAAWLAAWWTCLGIVLGALANVWMQRLSGGQWGEALRPVAFALARRMPWVLLLGVPVAIGIPWLYPWAAADANWLDGIARPAFLSSWLQPSFFVARLAVYALVWWWLAQQRDPGERRVVSRQPGGKAGGARADGQFGDGAAVRRRPGKAADFVGDGAAGVEDVDGDIRSQPRQGEGDRQAVGDLVGGFVIEQEPDLRRPGHRQSRIRQPRSEAA